MRVNVCNVPYLFRIKGLRFEDINLVKQFFEDQVKENKKKRKLNRMLLTLTNESIFIEEFFFPMELNARGSGK